MNAPFKSPDPNGKPSPKSAKKERDPTDFYPTPHAVTRALLAKERFPGTIWEPACGAGDICKVFNEQGYPNPKATDLYPKGNFGTPGIDFLKTEVDTENLVDHIVTNPPFKFARQFILHAKKQSTCKVAMLLQLSFLESAIREDFFEEHPPARIWVIRNRLTLYSFDDIKNKRKQGKGKTAMAWFVWDQSHRGRPTIDWITVEQSPRLTPESAKG